MPTLSISVLFLIIIFLLMIGRIRVFLRTGLKGEFLLVIGCIIFILGNIINSDLLIIAGFIVANIGLIILVSIELGAVREIFRQTSFFERLIGNIRPINRVKTIEAKSKTLIPTGILCLLLSLILFSSMDNYEINRMIVFSVLAVGGIVFIIFGIVKR